MALDFPASPSLNQVYPTPAVTGVPVYTWDGEKWTTKGGAVGSTGGADDPPLADGTAAAGVSTQWAREDHVHPVDTSRAPLASPTFTGDPKAPTPTAGDNDTSIATTAFVVGALSTGIVHAVRVQKFTASGTYTPSAGMINCIVECYGGGGGGGSCFGTSGTIVGAAGGGAGSKSIYYGTAASIGASKAVSIGAGGAAGTGAAGTGGNGGDTSLGSLCIGKGGFGGTFANGLTSLPSPGFGGVAGTGDLTGSGQPGTAGFLFTGSASAWASGSGGSTDLGCGGQGVFAGGGSFTGGLGGAAPGGGGGGASVNNSGSGPTGGSGAAGMVVITEFCSQ